MVTVKRHPWVKPGQQWSGGETYEQYVKAGKPVASGYTHPEAVSPEPPVGVREGREGIREAEPKDTIIQKLLDELERQRGLPTWQKERERLEEERRIPELEAEVGTWEDEVGKTRDMLADFEQRLRGGLVAEEARLAPMELLTGRQAEIQRQAGVEEADILRKLESAQRGLGLAEKRLTGEESDILLELDLIARDRGMPLDLLTQELGIMGDIESLFAPSEREVDTFVDAEGNRVITFYDEKTGETRQVNVGVVEEDVRTTIIERNGRQILINAESGDDIRDLGLVPERTEALSAAEEPEKKAVFETETGEEIDLGTVEGVKQAAAQGYNYADIYAALDENTKLTVSSIKNLLRQAELESPEEVEEREERKYNISSLMTQIRNALKVDYKKSVDDFMLGLRSILKDLTEADIESAKELYVSEQKRVSELDWLARREYFKL